MENKQTTTNEPTRPPAAPANTCESGCQFHRRRLEVLNRQLATRNDELRREIERLEAEIATLRKGRAA